MSIFSGIPLLVLVVVSLPLQQLQAQKFNPFQPIFNQDEIVRKNRGRELLKFMNLSADPCEDFYEFACGNWGKYHPLPRDFDSAMPIHFLEMKIRNDLQNILDEQVTTADGLSGRRVKEFYRSCLTAEKNGPLQQAFFSEFISSNGGFPAVPGSNWLQHHDDYNWQEVTARLRLNYGLDILIGLRIDLNHLSMHGNSLYLGEPSTMIPPHLCSAEDTQRVDIRERTYEPIEKEVASNLKQWLTIGIEEARKIAADIVTFEFDLCSGMKGNEEISPGLYPSYVRETLQNLSARFNGSINFNDYVQKSFAAPYYKPVFLSTDRYFWQLIKTVQEHNTTTIANYIMYRALSMLSFPLDDSGQKRSDFCLNVTRRYFPKVVGEMYHRKYANVDSINILEFLFQKLKDSFHRSLRREWIEESTARVGLKKLSEISLSFPKYKSVNLSSLKWEHLDYWHKLSAVMAYVQGKQFNRLADDDFSSNSNEIESYDTSFDYQSPNKRIDVGWGLLQAPFYHPGYPKAVLFASVGQRMAYQLARAFDDSSWSSDYLGLSNWDRSTEQGYLNRSECFRRQVSNYLSNNPQNFFNYTRLRHVIASSGGLNVAFNAYLQWLHYLNPNNDFDKLSKETLPEVNFTNTQLFFITYAQMFCRAERKTKPAPHYSPLLWHTMARFEVNGPLSNFAEFARDFRCIAGTEMNPADKCVIY